MDKHINRDLRDRVRMIAAFKKCIENLEKLQEKFSPDFNEDPMVLGYLQQLRLDIAYLEKPTPEELAYQVPDWVHPKEE